MKDNSENILITLERWNNGERPKKLYHMTMIQNVLDIADDGILINPPNKMFKQLDNKVYLANSISFCEDYLVDLFAEALANKFESKDNIKTLEIRYMIFEVDADKLDINKLHIDDILTPLSNNEYIKSFTYDENIDTSKIHLITNIYTQVYLKEELIERFNLN